ncbi:MAG: hypothetical protein COX80_02625 [Candidatus Magasanikbacteria bacterium CG_4_10_14_0_2_um_filter_33_14]|uniref:Uncharacterized protein n=1 Tax=Candidatus Magasanikbacteria bacterium CG_4_10_14_0_2_um_filter_33_14 TaxID=1974636 RepID=A0A2M7VAU1_9BACT|nr:MAG: hypothetical protein COX80_02625 [Candidatus Magasanikbacteria bacterium CG_4_10_14_0_2_um_filter_33_14]
MKILLVNKYWYIRGGSERVVFATKEILEKNGHEVVVFGMKNDKNIVENDYFIDDIDYKKISAWKKFILGFKIIYNKDAKKKFASLVEDFKPEVIHFHNIYHQLSFSLFDVVKNKKIPSVLTLHDYKMISPNYNLFHHGKLDESSCGRNYYKCLLKNCMENFVESFLVTCEAYFRKWKKWNDVVSVYISPSIFLKNKFLSVGFQNLIEVIPNPLVDLKSEVDLSVGQYVLYMGRLSEEKGVTLFLDFAKKLPHINFKMVGEGPLGKFLEKSIKQENIKNIELLGHQTGDVLDNIIKKSKFLVMPSQWFENYALSVLEAHVLGKVVLASDLGGLSEMMPKEMLVNHGDINLWVEKITEWFNKNEKELIKIEKGLCDKVREENNIDSYYQHLTEVYKKILL